MTGAGPQPSSKTGPSMYSAHVRDMMETLDGLINNMLIQENRKAGIGPNAVLRYGHSPPDSLINVPNSAYTKAPETNQRMSLI